MQFSIVIDQVKAIEWGLSVSECAVLDFITKAASWAQTKEKDGLTFYWVTFGKLKEDLPLVATSEQTTRRIIRRLEQTGLILAENFGNMATYRLTDKGKQWNTNQPAKVEAQPTKLAGSKKKEATKLEGQACQNGRVEPAKMEGPSIRVLDTKELEQESQVAIATTAKPKWTDYASLTDSIKEVCKSQGWAYDGTQEKNFARHILTAKDFSAQAETVGLSPQEYAIQIVRASALLDFWAGKVTGPKAIYKQHSKIYNAAKEFKRTQQPQNQFQTL
jgi:hypothetical protein